MNAQRKNATRNFASRLKARMVAAGLSQSDLARKAEFYMPAGRDFGRHLVNYYLRQRGLPGPVNLLALSKALGVTPDELLPDSERGGHWTDPDPSPVTIRASSRTGFAVVTLNSIELPVDVAAAVMKLCLPAAAA